MSESQRYRCCTAWLATRCASTLLMLLTTAGTGAASEYSDQVIADGAIHYWRFEETDPGQPAADQISGVAGQSNNPGTYSSGITLGQGSGGLGLGSAMRLDGVAHVDLGSPQHAGDSMSVEAWVNLDVDATASFSPIIARWDGSYELDVNATDQPNLGVDRVDFVLRNDVNAFGDPTSPTAIARGEWHHVAGVYDATTGNGTVYLDGVAGDPFALGGVLQDAGGDDGSWYIGTTRSPSSGFGWKGLIDEVAIYSRALTAEEIQNHIQLASIPEPSSVMLLSVGWGALLLGRRRARK